MFNWKQLHVNRSAARRAQKDKLSWLLCPVSSKISCGFAPCIASALLSSISGTPPGHRGHQHKGFFPNACSQGSTGRRREPSHTRGASSPCRNPTDFFLQAQQPHRGAVSTAATSKAEDLHLQVNSQSVWPPAWQSHGTTALRKWRIQRGCHPTKQTLLPAVPLPAEQHRNTA